jgi:hypothetical protein
MSNVNDASWNNVAGKRDGHDLIHIASHSALHSGKGVVYASADTGLKTGLFRPVLDMIVRTSDRTYACTVNEMMK